MSTLKNMLARKLRSKYSRSVIEDAATECAENPRYLSDGVTFDDAEDRAYLAECLNRPIRESDWEFFTRRRASEAKRVEVQSKAMTEEDECPF